MSQQEQAPKLTFQPQINSDFDCQRTRLNFYERQQLDCQEREYKQKVLSEAKSTAVLRRQMQPQLCRPPSTTAFKSDAGVSLYETAFKHQSNIEALRQEQEIHLRKLANEQKSIPTSNLMVDKHADERLQAIFETLDSDGDGLINFSRINVEGIEPKVCKVLSPLLLELNDRPDVSLDCKSFVLMVKEFMRVARYNPAYKYT